jgi:hypothetical protein
MKNVLNKPLTVFTPYSIINENYRAGITAGKERWKYVRKFKRQMCKENTTSENCM